MQQIYLVLTERCNLTCSHCIRDSSPYRSETAELVLMQGALSQIKQEYPEATVLLTGGEPTIYKGFDILLDTCISYGLDTIVNTNGATGYFRRADLGVIAANKVLVQVSIDGSRTQHDLIRGPGTFDRSTSTLRLLVSAGIRCSVSVTVMEQNFFNGADELIAELESLGLTHIAIKRATYAGRSSAGTPLTSAEWNAGVYSLRSRVSKTPVRMTPMFDFHALSALSDAQVASIAPGPFDTNCGAGTAKVYVYPDGDVCGCTCFRDIPIGNLNSDALVEIIRSYNPPQVKSDTCISCRYFSACRGGCLGSGYRYTSVLGAPDPRCGAVATGESGRSPIDVTQGSTA